MLVLSGGKTDQRSGASAGGSGGAGSGTPGGITVEGKSVREYLIASKATKIPQQMTVIGNYLLKTEQGKREIEAWLLYDGWAIAAAFRENQRPKLPGNPENISDPKKYLRDRA